MKSLKVLLSAALIGLVAFSAVDKADANPLNYTINVQDPMLSLEITGQVSSNNIVKSDIDGTIPVLQDTVNALNNGNISTDVYAQVTAVGTGLTLVGNSPTASSQLGLQMKDESGVSMGFLSSSTPLKVATLATTDSQSTLLMDAYLGAGTASNAYTFQVTYTAQATPTP